MPREPFTFDVLGQRLVAARDQGAARQILGVEPLGWSWKYSDEPGGRHDGDRCITTDTGAFADATVLMLDSGFTIEPGGQPPTERWTWFADRGFGGYVELQAVNRPNAWALYWCTRIEPYATNTTPDAPVGDVDMLHVEAIDVGGALRFMVGDLVHVTFIPVAATKEA